MSGFFWGLGTGAFSMFVILDYIITNRPELFCKLVIL